MYMYMYLHIIIMYEVSTDKPNSTIQNLIVVYNSRIVSFSSVIVDSSLITGGHAVSKVRLMDEENEVSNLISFVILWACMGVYL